MRWVVGLLLLVALLTLSYLPVTLFTVRLPRENDELVHAMRVREGDPVVLSYRHSVEGAAVVGWFEVGEGPDLLAVETRMASVGTGLPNAPRRTRRVGDWLVVDEAKRRIPHLRFFLMPINEPRLTVSGTDVHIERLRAGALISMDVERVSAWRWLLWMVSGKSWPIDSASQTTS